MVDIKRVESILADLQVASPCSASWNNMAETKSEGVRFCGQCSKNVFNISAMSSADAEALLTQGSLDDSPPCIRFFRRQDGTIISDDCPVGLRRIRNAYRQIKIKFAACMSFILLAIPAAEAKEPDYSTMGRYVPSARNLALRKPSVQKISDQIQAIRTKTNLSNSERLDILRLRLQMAQEAEKEGVPRFALEELPHVYQEASDISDANLSSQRKDLLKEVLQAQIENAKIVKVSDLDFQKKLQKLEQTKSK